MTIPDATATLSDASSATYHLVRANDGQCYFELRADGVALVTSAAYLRAGSALLGIEACRHYSQYAAAYRIDVPRDRIRRPFAFELWSNNGSVLVSGQSFDSETAREQAISRFRRLALTEAIEVNVAEAAAVVVGNVELSLPHKARPNRRR